MKPIGIITTSRSDWGLLNKIAEQLTEFSLIKEVRASGDRPGDIARTIGLNFIHHADFSPRPSMVICLGDRHDLFPIVTCAFLHKIPIAHLHGGEKTAGSYDDIWRTGISSMASLHFPATEQAARNLAHMGIIDNVHMVGALGVDGLKKRNWQPFGSGTGNRKVLLMLYPETRGNLHAGFIADLRTVLSRHMGKDVISIGSQPDVESKEYESRVSMARDEFLSLLSQCEFVIGNSSAGIIEAPALGVPTINIGARQLGREMAPSIIHAEANIQSVQLAFNRLYSGKFQDLMLSNYECRYKGKGVAKKIVKIVKSYINRI
jgi:GDP/UDP-N,N'-diacetylbacillosamine 2-epimerase (hydrolysing)